MPGIISYGTNAPQTPPPGQPFITGASGGTIRTDQLWVGYAFQVASKNLTVTALGRVVLAGNSFAHLINLLDAAGNLLAQVSVATAGQPVGGFVYTKLPSSVLLTAGAEFFVLSREDSSDGWLNSDMAYTTSADASLIGGAYLTFPSDGTGAIVPYGSAPFVPPNFQYTS